MKTDKFGNTNCPGCGASYEMVGLVHNCRPKVYQEVPEERYSEAVTAPEISKALKTHVDEVDAALVAPLTAAERHARWRDAHPDLHRERARTAMRRKRGG